MGLVLYFSSQKFQSTLPQRERRWEFKECNIATYISIHAPAKGATSSRYPFSWSYSSFQSTLPRRERHPLVRHPDRQVTDFNPRSREGSDFRILCSLNPIGYFNPRSHKGSDHAFGSFCSSSHISIHAPTKGATHFISRKAKNDTNFNPRSHEGSDRRNGMKEQEW